MNFGAEQVIGLLGLLVLIPFIIVYLIKPKPVKLPVPSLMFFMKKTKISVQDSLFRIFQKDYLFFIQLVVLVLLALSLAYPYFAKSQDVVSKNIIFVLDASGSMHTIERIGSSVSAGSGYGKTRFDIAKDEIKKLVSDSNTLILIKSYPVIAVKNAGKSEFLAFLNRLQLTEGESRIGDAILMGGEIVDSGKGRIIVVSDFINTKGVSVKIAQDILLGKGINVDLIDVGENNHENLGIVNIVADEESSSVFIKNYGKNGINVNLNIDGENQSLAVEADDTEPFIYKTKEGVSKIEIKNKDDFISDNFGYIANPAGQKINVMLITNSPMKFLTAAINSSSRVRLKVVEPPVIPKDDPNFKTDVYIIGKVDYTKILAGTFEDLLKKAQEGASVVITSQDGINNVDFKGLNNIKFISGYDSGNVTTKTGAIILNTVTKFTKDVDFGAVKKAYNVNDIKGDVIAESNDVPLIVYSEIGSGKVVYYGILEKESSFQLSPDYPVFWSSLIKDLVGAREMSELNLKTGMSFIDNKNNEIVVDNIGVFNISSNEIAVNMNSFDESDINFIDSGVSGEKISGYNFKTIKEEVKTSLIDYLIIVGLILVLFEIYYIKNRGEL